MCGIVGVAGKIFADEDKIFKDLLYMDELRGKDSTGVVAVAAYSGAMSYHKRAIGAQDFLDSKKGSALITQSNRVLIGHNRWKTKGAVNHQNAHPFHHGHIIGVHNGTLKDQSLLPDSKEFDVDSDNIFYSISTLGVEETHRKLHGAFALVWWNSEDKTLNFLRNSERTLYIARKRNQETIYWASEKFMLMAAMDRRDVIWEDIYALPVNKHLRFTMDVNPNVATNNFKFEPIVKELEPYVPPKTTSRWVGTSNVKKLPAANTSQNSAAKSNSLEPAFIRDKGYSFSSKIDFLPLDTKGCKVQGVTLDDNSMDIEISCPTNQCAKEMLAEVEEGHYFTLERMSGFVSSSPRFSSGALLGRLGDCVCKSFVSGAEVIEEEEIEETTILDHAGAPLSEDQFNHRYKYCSFCSDTLEFEDNEFFPFTHNEALCGACATQPSVREMCNMTR